MWKGLFLTVGFVSLLTAQNPSFLLTQKGLDKHKSIFLNPSHLALYQQQEGIESTFLNADILLSREAYSFLDELSETTSSSHKSKDIAALLKKNIGNIISVSANNFSSIQAKYDNVVGSLGVADSFNAYYIPHTGFGSKGALESAIEKYRIVMATLASKSHNFYYGFNLKSIKKTEQNHNYSIQEMLYAQDLESYLKTTRGESDTRIAVDAGVTYVSELPFKPIVSLSFLDIGNTSFKSVESIESSVNLGMSLEPYPKTSLELNYLDLFKAQRQQSFEQQLRVNLSYNVFDSLYLKSGWLYRSLVYGIEYQHEYFHIGLNSYTTEYQHRERKYELSFRLLW